MKLTRLFDDKLFYKSLFAIAIPIMLQNLMSAAVNMIGTVMIGQLGTVEIAAVGLGTQVYFILNMILFGVCSGGAVFTSQYWGKKDIAGIRRNTGFCLTIVICFSTLFTVACLTAPRFIISLYSNDPAVISVGAKYLRAVAPCFIPFSISFVFTLIMRTTERVKLSIVATMISLTINILFSWLLIFGIGPFPAMGVTGAATATVIARFVEMFILIITVYVRKYALAGTLQELFGFDLLFVSRFFRIAFPVMVNETLWSLGITMQNVIFARTQTDAIAAFNIVNIVSNLTWVIFIGLGNGAAVLIGKKIGEKSEATARDYASRITLFAPLLAAGVALFLIPISWILPFVFNVNGAVLSITASMFIILTVSYPFRAFNMAMIIGVCRAGGDTVFGVLYDLLFMWSFSLPLAAASSYFFHVPAWLIYLCIATEDPLKMMLGIWRLKRGKWLHNVT